MEDLKTLCLLVLACAKLGAFLCYMTAGYVTKAAYVKIKNAL